MGVKKTTDVVEKSTWMLSLALLVFTLMINLWIDRGSELGDPTQLRDKAESVPSDVSVPGLQTPGTAAPGAPAGQIPAAPGGAAPAPQGQGAAPGATAPIQ
jgi:hypothetical protein